MRLSKKTLLVASATPPRIGGTPGQLYNLFRDIEPESYVVYTSPKSLGEENKGERLRGKYVPFPPGFFPRLGRGLSIIREERIELVHAISDDGSSFFLGLLLSLFSGKPLSVQFYDVYYGNAYSGLRNIAAYLVERALFARASLVLFYNPVVKELYEKRYGASARFHIVPNCTFPESYEKLRTPYAPKAPYRVLFTGSIYWAQEESLVRMIDAVIASSLDVSFDIYAPRIPARLEKEYAAHPRIRFKSGRPEEMAALQAAADILFVPLSWPKESALVANTSFPGKMPEYLASGRPILVHAPPESYLIAHAKETGAGAAVDVPDVSVLRETMERILLDPDYGKTLVAHALAAFAASHDARKNSQLLVGFLNSL